MANKEFSYEVQYVKEGESYTKIVFALNENFAKNQIAETEHVNKSDIYYVNEITTKSPLASTLLMFLMYLTIFVTLVFALRIGNNPYETTETVISVIAYGFAAAVLLVALAEIVKNLFLIAHKPTVMV